MKISEREHSGGSLWTRGYTIITVGSLISMLGNTLAGFAISLLVLDYTHSTFCYALYLVIYMCPRIVMPILAGPLLDRFSRRRAIFTLDFFSSGFYVLLAVVLHTGWFNFAFFLVACFILGSVDSIYGVAYESFYPLLVTKDNYSKAYSVSSTLETLALVATPLSALIYKKVGIVPLFLVNAVSYFAAAVMETRIRVDEAQCEKHKAGVSSAVRTAFGRFRGDFREGILYLRGERGLLAIAAYFSVSAFSAGASQVITLPYFKSAYRQGIEIYIVVWGLGMLGRLVGGGLHYRISLPAKSRYAVALTVYIATSLLEGTYLYFSVTAMMVMCFAEGILGITSYNIRLSATQSYVPNDRKGRFNGTFATMSAVGTLVGQLAAGGLSEVLPNRVVLSACMGVCALAAVVLIGGNKKSVSAIYNAEV